MSSPVIENLQKLVNTPRDGALLRYALGNEWLKQGNPALAAESLRASLALDPRYSAAWKLLGKALVAASQPAEALATYRQGIVTATERGDIQAAKEMQVFARRLEKELGHGSDTEAT